VSAEVNSSAPPAVLGWPTPGGMFRFMEKPAPSGLLSCRSSHVDTLPTIDEVDQALRDLGAGAAGPEAHGGLCGLVCVLGAEGPATWVAELRPGAGPAPGAPAGAGDILRGLATVTCQALTEGDMSFVLLLPGDEVPLGDRTEALAVWCTGFLEGLGTAAGRSRYDLSGNEVAREILADFSEIARAGFESGEPDGEAEAAYVELVEFVRVSVQLLFEELYPLRRGAPRTGLH
jgi:uncharacterized protein YgfB (UPF0149 family)